MLKHEAEALLFSSGKAMEEEQLAGLTGSDRRRIRAALQELKREYEERESALRLFVDGSLWKLVVKDEYLPLVRRIVADTELSKATLETLAVIAYHQPNVLQSKVVELRGSAAYEQITELQELGFVTKTREGRSYALRLTEKFYDYFDVEDETVKRVFDEVKPPAERQAALEVVDLPEEPAEPEFTEPPPKAPESAQERTANEEFLTRIERQIDELAGKNDEREGDADFAPARGEEPAEGGEKDGA